MFQMELLGKNVFCWLRGVLSQWLLDYSLEVDKLSRRLYHYSSRWVIRLM